MFSLALGVLVAMGLAAYVYVRRERLGAVGAGLAALRTLAFAALLVAFINPTKDIRQRGGPTTVLLDASLSMNAAGAHWRAALDSARAYRGANPRSTMFRFGGGVAPFDTTPPGDGSTNLAAALAAAAGREGSTVVVTDGEVDDWASVPPELARGVTLVTVPRDPLPDLALLDVAMPATIQRADSVSVTLTVGSWSVKDTSVVLEAYSGATRLVRKPLNPSPGTGTAQRTIVLAGKALPLGTSTLRFVLIANDAEPRDDVRVRPITVVETPAIVVIADPADYEGRFLFSGLASVAPGRVRGLALVAPDHWVDMRTLASVRAQDVASAARQASLLVVRGQYAASGVSGARWTWGAGAGGSSVMNGDWYAASAPASPLAAGLAAADWDSLPPLTALVAADPGPQGWVALTARLGRGGVERAVVVGQDSGGARRLTTAGMGLWRWSLRGGSPREAYRALLAAGVDWLLAPPTGASARLVASPVVPRGVPVEFRWTGPAQPDSIVVTFAGDSGAVRHTLHFQNGVASVRLAAGSYRWQAAQVNAAGFTVVEPYSDEFHPRPVTVASVAGAAGLVLVAEQARERWWLFALAMAALIAEWVWRQRRGLP
ncbi:MAG TPA: hypothetical protein VGI83_02100 [Gemmatimonadales bacterium]